MIVDDDQRLFNSPIFSLPVTISVSVGRATMTVEQILSLDSESVIELDSTLETPVKIFVGDHLFALGELIETEASALGVRITEFGKK